MPIGAALVHDRQVLAVGRNRRVQMGSAIRHAETDCIEQAGRLPASVYRRSPVTERDAATLATSALAAQAGAWGVRVHDVAPTVDAVRALAATLAHRRHGTSGRCAARRAG